MTTRFYLTVALCGVLAGTGWGGPVIVPDDQLKLGDTALPTFGAQDYVMPCVQFMDSAAGTEGAGAMTSTSTDGSGEWSLKRYSIGRTFSEQPKDCSIGDWCTQFPVDSREIDWARTFDAVRDSEAYKNGYIEVFDTTDSADHHLLFTRGGTVEIRFVKKDERSAWKTYTVGMCNHPNRLYATRSEDGDAVSYLDLSGKQVQFFGDANLITPQYSEPQGGVSNVVWGLDYDKDNTQRLMARYRVIDEDKREYDSPQGQFVLAQYETVYYETVNYWRVGDAESPDCQYKVENRTTEQREKFVSAIVVEIVPPGASEAMGSGCQVALPTGLEGYGYVVSNLTTGVEVNGVGSGVGGATYDLPIGAKVAIYAAPAEGYAVIGTNPYVIDEVTAETTLEGVALPMAVYAGDAVGYLEWDEVNMQMTNATCTAYEPYVGQTVLDAGKTYVVKTEQTVGSRIVVNGTPDSPTRLILCDGAKLMVNGGIGVASDKALVICGQTPGTGLLAASGEDFAAGIGGGYNGAGGTVTINGGAVAAQGSCFGAGIGGGAFGAGGAVTINGGKLKVRADAEVFEIGAGWNGASQGTVAVAGGIFSWKPNDGWLVDPSRLEIGSNPDATTCADYPWIVWGIPGTVLNPWTVGEGATAYVKDGTLFIDGVGAVTSMPWAENADGIVKLAVAEGVTGLQGFVRSLPDLTTANGLTLAELNGLAVGVLPADIATAKVDAATQAATITVEVKTTETETNQVWKTVVTTNIVVPVESPVGYLKLVTKPAEEE